MVTSIFRYRCHLGVNPQPVDSILGGSADLDYTLLLYWHFSYFGVTVRDDLE